MTRKYIFPSLKVAEKRIQEMYNKYQDTLLLPQWVKIKRELYSVEYYKKNIHGLNFIEEIIEIEFRKGGLPF